MEFQYELFVEKNTTYYLVNPLTNKKEYKIVDFYPKNNLIKVEALNFNDNIKMYAKDIKGFKNRFPEWFI